MVDFQQTLFNGLQNAVFVAIKAFSKKAHRRSEEGRKKGGVMRISSKDRRRITEGAQGGVFKKSYFYFKKYITKPKKVHPLNG